jgi:predicted transcriptional regulator
MTHRNVEQLLGRLLTDPALRRRFGESPEQCLAVLSQQGLELSAVEVEALATTDADSLETLAERLDRRLRKADER